MALKHTHTIKSTREKLSKKRITHDVTFEMIVITILEMCYIGDTGFTEMAADEFKNLTAKKIEARVLDNLMYKGMNFYFFYYDKSGDTPDDEVMQIVRNKAAKLFTQLV